MSRPLEFSALSPAERRVAVGAWLGVVNGIVPWWHRGTGPTNALQNAGFTLAGSIAFGCFAAAAVFVLVRAWFWPKPSKGWDGAFYLCAGLGAIAASVTLFAGGRPIWIGVVLADALGFLLVAGGARRLRERRQGWS